MALRTSLSFFAHCALAIHHLASIQVESGGEVQSEARDGEVPLHVYSTTYNSGNFRFEGDVEARKLITDLVRGHEDVKGPALGADFIVLGLQEYHSKGGPDTSLMWIEERKQMADRINKKVAKIVDTYSDVSDIMPSLYTSIGHQFAQTFLGTGAAPADEPASYPNFVCGGYANINGEDQLDDAAAADAPAARARRFSLEAISKWKGGHNQGKGNATLQRRPEKLRCETGNGRLRKSLAEKFRELQEEILDRNPFNRTYSKDEIKRRLSVTFNDILPAHISKVWPGGFQEQVVYNVCKKLSSPHYKTELHVYVNPASQWELADIVAPEKTNSKAGGCGKTIEALKLVLKSPTGGSDVSLCAMNTHLDFKGSIKNRVDHLADALEKYRELACDATVFGGDFNTRMTCRLGRDALPFNKAWSGLRYLDAICPPADRADRAGACSPFGTAYHMADEMTQLLTSDSLELCKKEEKEKEKGKKEEEDLTNRLRLRTSISTTDLRPGFSILDLYGLREASAFMPEEERSAAVFPPTYKLVKYKDKNQTDKASSKKHPGVGYLDDGMPWLVDYQAGHFAGIMPLPTLPRQPSYANPPAGVVNGGDDINAKCGYLNPTNWPLGEGSDACYAAGNAKHQPAWTDRVLVGVGPQSGLRASTLSYVARRTRLYGWMDGATGMTKRWPSDHMPVTAVVEFKGQSALASPPRRTGNWHQALLRAHRADLPNGRRGAVRASAVSSTRSSSGSSASPGESPYRLHRRGGRRAAPFMKAVEAKGDTGVSPKGDSLGFKALEPELSLD